MFGLIPLSIAICVTILSGAFLSNKIGLPSIWIWIIAPFFGFVSWALYWLILRNFATWLDYKNTKRDMSSVEKRVYQDFDAAKNCSAAKNLYYECNVCGNVVPSWPGRKVSCKCQNIVVDASGRPTIQRHEKAKLFTVSE
jgi:hypothetical protein